MLTICVFWVLVFDATAQTFNGGINGTQALIYPDKLVFVSYVSDYRFDDENLQWIDTVYVSEPVFLGNPIYKKHAERNNQYCIKNGKRPTEKVFSKDVLADMEKRLLPDLIKKLEKDKEIYYINNVGYVKKVNKQTDWWIFNNAAEDAAYCQEIEESIKKDPMNQHVPGVWEP